MKGILSKTVRVVRAAALGVGLAVVLVVMLGLATTALAAAPGDPFRLGRVNLIDKISVLRGEADATMLRIVNRGEGTALQLFVQRGEPPMRVNSVAKVPRLNADRVDGKHAGAFLPRNGKAADADRLDGEDASGFYRYGEEIPSGATVTGAFGGHEQDAEEGDNVDYVEVISLPLPAPDPLSAEDVNFADPDGLAIGDGDPSCTGTIREPTAPPGKVCLYANVRNGDTDSFSGEALSTFIDSRNGFRVVGAGNFTGRATLEGTWAYTAP